MIIGMITKSLVHLLIPVFVVVVVPVVVPVDLRQLRPFFLYNHDKDQDPPSLPLSLSVAWVATLTPSITLFLALFNSL